MGIGIVGGQGSGDDHLFSQKFYDTKVTQLFLSYLVLDGPQFPLTVK